MPSRPSALAISCCQIAPGDCTSPRATTLPMIGPRRPRSPRCRRRPAGGRVAPPSAVVTACVTAVVGAGAAAGGGAHGACTAAAGLGLPAHRSACCGAGSACARTAAGRCHLGTQAASPSPPAPAPGAPRPHMCRPTPLPPQVVGHTIQEAGINSACGGKVRNNSLYGRMAEDFRSPTSAGSS